jgi:four helix bundle protein
MNKFDLEERLISFSIMIINIVEALPNTRSANHLAGQLIRSGNSPALNYGEAQSAESRKDFIHKIKISLKELRETYVCLKIIYKANLSGDKNNLDKAISENNELISIFVKSIETAQNNLKNVRN